MRLYVLLVPLYWMRRCLFSFHIIWGEAMSTWWRTYARLRSQTDSNEEGKNQRDEFLPNNSQIGQKMQQSQSHLSHLLIFVCLRQANMMPLIKTLLILLIIKPALGDFEEPKLKERSKPHKDLQNQVLLFQNLYTKMYF